MILDHLVAGDPTPAPIESVEAWWARHAGVAAGFPTPIDTAAAGGFAADRLGWAFASGYQAAGAALFGSHAHEPTALCATEAGGAHPRAIATTLERDEHGALRLTGEKAYVTLGTFAQALLVLASEGTDEAGRKILRMVHVDARREGVRVEPLPPPPFVPEIPHARVKLDAVVVHDDEVLPGDGWNDYVRPFRTIEDCHVHAALLGWLIQIARRFGFPPEIVEQALGLVAALRTVALADPASPATHRALAGIIATSRGLLASMDPLWAQVDDETRTRFERDRTLLSVAEKARAQRLAAAREKR